MKVIPAQRVHVEVTYTNYNGEHISVRCLDEINFQDKSTLAIHVIKLDTQPEGGTRVRGGRRD